MLSVDAFAFFFDGSNEVLDVSLVDLGLFALDLAANELCSEMS